MSLRSCIFIIVSLVLMSINGFGSESMKSSSVELFVRWGIKDSNLTFKKATETSEDLGPTSFYVDGKNQIYILDSNVRRVKVFLNNNLVKIISLDTPYYPQDILLHGNEIYLLTNTTIEKLDKDGNTLLSNLTLTD